MEKLKSLEDLGDAVKEQKPKKIKVKTISEPVTKTKIIQVKGGLKAFRNG